MEFPRLYRKDRLARSEDLKVVRRHADLIRKAVRPLMRKPTTRRLAVEAYELVSRHPLLPRDLGTRPLPAFTRLNEQRYIAAPNDVLVGCGASLELLQDTTTGQRYIFKRGDTANLTLRSQAIDGPSQPQRARAATLIAASLGIATPTVDLVEYRGSRGSLQMLEPNTTDLSRLAQSQRVKFEELIRSRAFATQRSDIWILDRLTGNLDRQSHNILVRLKATPPQLIPVDHDLTFPPTRAHRPLLGVRPYRPRQVRRETYQRLQELAAEPDLLTNVVAPLLTKPEVEAVVARLNDTIAIIANAVANRGEASVFF